MRLVLHLIRWDVRRFQILLLLWLLLVAASAVLEGAWPAIAVAMAARNTVGLAGNLLAVAEVFFSIALVTLVVQEHPLVGTSAFWMTRPIPPRALLAAKVVLLSATMVLAPVLAEVVLMIDYEVPAGEIAAVAAQSAVFWALWIVIVMAFAALTPNMARFALAVSGVIISIIVSLVMITSILIDRADERPPIPTAEQMYDPTSGVVSTLVLIGAAMALLAVLYRTRGRAGAVAIGLAGLAAAWFVPSVWPWPLLAPTIETPAWAQDSSILQLSADPGTVNIGSTVLGSEVSPPAWRVARARMRLNGLAPGWTAGVGMRETVLRVDGHEALTSDLRGAPASVAIDDAESVQNHEVIRRLLNVQRLVAWMQQTKAESAVVMVARTADLRQLAADRGRYEGRFQVSLARHDIEIVLPFRSGAATRVGAYRFAVDRIQLLPSRIQILARESNTRSVFDGQPRSRIDYYLRNAHTSEAVQGSFHELRSDVTLSRFLPFVVVGGGSEHAGFRTVASEVNFSTGYGGQQEIVFDDSWLEHTELVIVRSTEGGAVERRVAMADFPIRTE